MIFAEASEQTLLTMQLPELKDIAQGSLSQETVDYMQEALTRHHGEPVRPVSTYCRALEQWMRALKDKFDRGEFDANDNDYLKKIAENALGIEISIRKSNLLWRLIYGGQSLRTRMCPKHRGRWSGYGWGYECECQDGYDITGWLPEHFLTLQEKIGSFGLKKGWDPMEIWISADKTEVTLGPYKVIKPTQNHHEAIEAMAELLRNEEGFDG